MESGKPVLHNLAPRNHNSFEVMKARRSQVQITKWEGPRDLDNREKCRETLPIRPVSGADLVEIGLDFRPESLWVV